MRMAHGLFIEREKERERERENAARAEAVWCYCDIWTDLFLDVPNSFLIKIYDICRSYD